MTQPRLSQLERAYNAIVERGLTDLSVRQLSAIAGVGRTTANRAMQRFREDLSRGHVGHLLERGKAAQLEVVERYYDDDGKLLRSEKIVLAPEEQQEMLDPVSDFSDQELTNVHDPDTVTDHA